MAAIGTEGRIRVVWAFWCGLVMPADDITRVHWYYHTDYCRTDNQHVISKKCWAKRLDLRWPR